MTPRPEPSRGLLHPHAHPCLTIMGDPEDDEEDEEEKKKREGDEDQEDNDGEDEEEPWKVNS